MARNILKEFLVSLGFEVDEGAYQAASRKVKAFEEKAAKMTEAIGKNAEKGAKVTIAALSPSYVDDGRKCPQLTE